MGKVNFVYLVILSTYVTFCKGDEGKKDGTGIHFLPGDISGLINQLHLLLAEFRAGNKSATKNQIVAILDQLLKRNYLTQDEYNGVCRTILC